jgi:hypothetical protein
MTDTGGTAVPGGVRVVDLSIPVGPETRSIRATLFPPCGER